VLKIRSEKDFWAGLLYVVLAIAFLWFGRDLKLGSASRMGPGYFPITLAWILGAFGAISIIRAFFYDGEKIDALAWKPLALITLGCVAFGIILKPGGLLLALPLLVLLASMASAESIYDKKGLLVLIGLCAFCIIVFVKLLGVPMPILGSWFDGIVPSTWQR
jgi:Tripartite tricarboxylate transporter TctB family